MLRARRQGWKPREPSDHLEIKDGDPKGSLAEASGREKDKAMLAIFRYILREKSKR